MFLTKTSAVISLSNTLWNILMILGSNEEQDQTYHITRMTTLTFLLLELLPLVMFEFNFLLLLCNMNTPRNILIMLGTNVEQDKMMCSRTIPVAGLGWRGVRLVLHGSMVRGSEFVVGTL